MRVFCSKLAVVLLIGGVMDSGVQNAVADEVRSHLSDQQALAVTIYNQDLALVKDQRRVTLNAGRVALAFRDVSGQLRAETAQLRSLSTPGGLAVLEQNFDFDLLSPAKLLEKSLGKEVTLVRTNPSTGADSSEKAKILSTHEGLVLQIGSRIETSMPGRLVFSELPSNLRDRPTLSMLLDNPRAGAQDVELSYLTSGLSWQADYVLELNPTEDKLGVNGWVTLTNQSGAAYPNAKLQLVAGNVNRAAPAAEQMADRAVMRMAKASAPEMAEESLFEYHLYSLSRPTTLAEQQTKQVSLLSAPAVPVKKSLVLNGSAGYYQEQAGELGEKLKFSVFLTFDNREAANLGMPLPGGVMRVYKKDLAGNAQFVGEDRVEHTAKNDTVRLKLGEAFDVNADRRQTDFKRVSNKVIESAYQLVLRNAKSEPVSVTVQEPIPGDWKMLSHSHPYVKTNAFTATWQITIPPEGKVVLHYRVAVKS